LDKGWYGCDANARTKTKRWNEGMGFIRRQEEKLALQYLIWSYQKDQHPLPNAKQLQQLASKLVDDAHRIALERGRNVVSIMKELVKEMADKNKNN
jgi:hypothetical protein